MKIKMRNIGILIKTLLIFCLFALIILNYNNVKSKQISVEDMKPLNSSQIDNFIKEKKITPVTIKNINNYTIILYKSNNVIGTYALTSDQYGNTILKSNSTGTDNSNITPVSIGSRGGWNYRIGGFDLIWLIINDNQILNKAHSVKIMLEDKTEKTVNIDNSKGLIIPIPSCKIQLEHIYIFDKENNILYEEEG